MARARATESGGVLGADQIRQRIDQGEIFVAGTWNEGGIRPASYDVRIAADRMRVPGDSPGSTSIHLSGEPRTKDVTLQPGDVAFVTSEEGFRIPADVAGNIGIRFGFAGPGLLVHTGLLIHPGFGLDRDEGRRLHFTIANLSPRPETFRPGDKIVSVQFFPVRGATASSPTSPPGRDDLERRYLVEDEPLGLAFLSGINRLDGQMGRLRQDVVRLERDLARVEKASSDLILFGVFIVAAAFLGVTATSLLAVLEDSDRAAAIGRGVAALHLNVAEALLLAAVILGLLAGTYLAVRGIGTGLMSLLRLAVNIGSRRWRERADKASSAP